METSKARVKDSIYKENPTAAYILTIDKEHGVEYLYRTRTEVGIINFLISSNDVDAYNIDLDTTMPAIMLIKWIISQEEDDILQGWQWKIVNERADLKEKHDAVSSLIADDDKFCKLDEEDRNLILSQRLAIGNYMHILDARIARF
jgi:hypothetical protein